MWNRTLKNVCQFNMSVLSITNILKMKLLMQMFLEKKGKCSYFARSSEGANSLMQ